MDTNYALVYFGLKTYTIKIRILYCLVQMKKGFKSLRSETFIIAVTPKRFERLTYCLEGSCSIQLSYGVGYLLPFIPKMRLQI